MKRSDINYEIHLAEEFFAKFSIHLPKFAMWSLADWSRLPFDSKEIVDCRLGWDVTDFGSGDFRHMGLLLFTLRNGVSGNPLYPKPYAEKIMISRSEQITPMHCHLNKCEDIINRGGGNLCFELFGKVGKRELSAKNFSLTRDGKRLTLSPGERLLLTPGESITLTPGIFHTFYAEKGSDVIVGEVSSVNDDFTDNLFYEELPRFPTMVEDESPYRRLVTDYHIQKPKRRLLW